MILLQFHLIIIILMHLFNINTAVKLHKFRFKEIKKLIRHQLTPSKENRVKPI